MHVRLHGRHRLLRFVAIEAMIEVILANEGTKFPSPWRFKRANTRAATTCYQYLCGVVTNANSVMLTY